ncbi:MAG: type IV pilus biogenesis/stability protein PilW [Gammaproteobacteria bacterium]|nr:MAG: type IV pilus biogenesis/stability protein PilW [Gammaproteobacteria bacterium]
MKSVWSQSAVLICLSVFLASCQSLPSRIPESSKAYTELGLAYLEKKSYSLAETKLKHAIELYERNAEAHHYLAELYRVQGRKLLARDEYERAIALDRDNPSIWNNYAVFLCGIGEYEASEKWFLKAARKRGYEKRAEAYENAGVCMLAAGNRDRAIRHFDNALGIELRERSLLQLATLEIDQGQADRAVENLKRLHQFFKPSPESLYLLARAEKDLGHSDQVEKIANQFQELFPDSPLNRKVHSLFESHSEQGNHSGQNDR